MVSSPQPLLITIPFFSILFVHLLNLRHSNNFVFIVFLTPHSYIVVNSDSIINSSQSTIYIIVYSRICKLIFLYLRRFFMYYTVVEEKCYEGIKSRYSKNQRIDDVELFNLMNDFNKYKYEIRNELDKKYYNFYDYNLFGKKIELYYLNLNKVR